MKQVFIKAIALTALTTSAFSQGGPLTPPPGAPAPTMKPLDLIEPRIPLVAGEPGVAIVSGTITISQAGSYNLTKNHEYAGTGDAIHILADGTTLDLMGHSVIFTGPGNGGAAIEIDANSILIHNGHILSTSTFDLGGFTPRGFAQGIVTDGLASRVTIRNLAISGVAGRSINLAGQGGQVAHCTAVISGSDAIYNPHGSVHECIVHVSVQVGITASVSISNNGYGIFARPEGSGFVTFGGIVSNSYGLNRGGAHGIHAEFVSHSWGRVGASGHDGIHGVLIAYSQGERPSTHVGIRAERAIGCRPWLLASKDIIHEFLMS